MSTLWKMAAKSSFWASVMDMSFANQALSEKYMNQNAKTLEKNVYGVP